GPFGWVGFSQSRQWYWSGIALVSIADTGDCRRILKQDPSTASRLSFRAVMPWVRDTPAKTTVVALLSADEDPLPFVVTIDLNANIYNTPRPFEPADARDLQILGTGASAKLRQGFTVVSYGPKDSRTVEAQFYDEEGDLVSRAPIADAGDVLE